MIDIIYSLLTHTKCNQYMKPTYPKTTTSAVVDMTAGATYTPYALPMMIDAGKMGNRYDGKSRHRVVATHANDNGTWDIIISLPSMVDLM